MVSEKRVLRRVLELYRLDVTGGWRKLHTAKKFVICQTLFRSKIRKMMGESRHVACFGETRHAHRILVREPEEKGILRK
jgi:hypothetical protein